MGDFGRGPQKSGRWDLGISEELSKIRNSSLGSSVKKFSVMGVKVIES